MSKHETIRAASRAMTPIIATSVTNARVQNIGFRPLILVPGAAAEEPASAAGGFMLLPGEYIGADVDWTDLFPGAASTEMLYVWGEYAVHLSVSHADAS